MAEQMMRGHAIDDSLLQSAFDGLGFGASANDQVPLQMRAHCPLRVRLIAPDRAVPEQIVGEPTCVPAHPTSTPDKPYIHFFSLIFVFKF